MLPFPRTRREIRPFIRDLRTRTERLIRRNRIAAIATAAGALVLVSGVAVWAFSGSVPGRPALVASANATARSATTAPRTLVKKDPLTAARKLYDAKKYEDAVQAFQPLLDEHVEARFWLGESHMKLGHTFRGCRQLEKYVELAPKGEYVTSAKRSLKKC